MSPSSSSSSVQFFIHATDRMSSTAPNSFHWSLVVGRLVADDEDYKFHATNALIPGPTGAAELTQWGTAPWRYESRAIQPIDKQLLLCRVHLGAIQGLSASESTNLREAILIVDQILRDVALPTFDDAGVQQGNCSTWLASALLALHESGRLAWDPTSVDPVEFKAAVQAHAYARKKELAQRLGRPSTRLRLQVRTMIATTVGKLGLRSGDSQQSQEDVGLEQILAELRS
ncbi:hypothetical protein BXZ70DRAFT_1079281 [Cristinia sonorae]|uniref:Uncharacterized protein n=1 Tax=Cristinia sonorae TaxID=1940300 RepID=A0A8K0UIC3_9AGAR|nr:hypothetical protein BXZ70DRAFT_1079281 [Cristinia sonorae]